MIQLLAGGDCLFILILLQQILSLMAFCRNPQRPGKASPQCAHKKGQRQASSHAKGAPNTIISTIRQLPESEKDWSESMRELLRQLLQEENKSMEAMLNSSINHFTQFITEHEDIETQNHELIKQNQCLTAAIEELRIILKMKLEAALKKQRQDLNVMMQDYIQLIQKLLKDKQSFASKLEEETKRADLAQQLVNAIAEEQLRNQEVLEAKQRVVEVLEKKVAEQTAIINDNRAKYQEIIKKNDELKAKILALEEKHSALSQSEIHDESQLHRQDVNASKVKLLLQLLEQSQAEIKKLREKLRQEGEGCRKDEVIHQLTLRINQLEQEHEEQFKQYQQSMRQVLARKDAQIEKLSKGIQSNRRQTRTPSS